MWGTARTWENPGHVDCSSFQVRRSIMSNTAWIVVLLLVFLLVGGGGYFYRR